jgi:hypothetical protein
MSPAVVFDMLAGLGGKVDRILIVGCEPAMPEEGIGLSGSRRACRSLSLRSTTCSPTRSNGVSRVVPMRGGEPMIRRLVLSPAATKYVLIVKSLPDIARYLKIREM